MYYFVTVTLSFNQKQCILCIMYIFVKQYIVILYNTCAETFIRHTSLIKIKIVYIKNPDVFCAMQLPCFVSIIKFRVEVGKHTITIILSYCVNIGFHSILFNIIICINKQQIITRSFFYAPITSCAYASVFLRY